MKRVGNIYEIIFSTENLKLAIKESLKNHNKNRKQIRWVLENEDLAIKMIQDNPHIVGNYREYEKIDGLSGKVRKIKVPRYFPDQIIHHALIRIVNPIFQKSYYKYTCSCVVGRGTLYASKHLRNVLVHDKKHTKYYTKIDIKKYYDNIDHNIMKAILRRKLKDSKVLALFDEIIDSADYGIPIGNYTSQILSNLYLCEFDHYVKEVLGVSHYIRYADDMVILGSNKRKLKQQILAIKEFLNTKLNLKTHNNEYIKEANMIDFCGYRHYRGFTTIRRKIFKRVRRTVLRIKAGKYSSSIMKRFASYLGYLKSSNSFKFVQKYCLNC